MPDSTHSRGPAGRRTAPTHFDASSRQIFTAATEAGRQLLGILSVQTTLPLADVGTLPPARVLPPTIPVRPFIVRRLH